MTTAHPAGRGRAVAPHGDPALWLLHAAGLTSIGVAAWECSGTPDVERQVDWLALAVAGALLAVVGGLAQVLRGRRRIVVRRTDLARRIGSHVAEVAADPGSTAPGQFLATAGMRHYHHPDCLLVRGKDAPAAPIAQHLDATRTACAVCRP